MIRIVVLSLAVMLGIVANQATAQEVDLQARVEAAMARHVLPSFAQFSQSSRELADVSRNYCQPEDAALGAAYHAAFDDWVRVSHLRFGPSETENRAFALAFWPDTRGKTPKALAKLLAAQDPVAEDVDALMQVTIAAQGFYALEFLLFDPQISTQGDAAYRCALIQGVTEGIARRAEAIHADWANGYASEMTQPHADGPYRTSEEATAELLKAISTGLQFAEEARLARPLGTFDRPRPKRAEAWRSERSLRHVVLSLEATRALTAALAGDGTAVAGRLDASFETTLSNAGFDDPIFASVADPIARMQVESLQQYINALREEIVGELTEALGVSIGFNALDGD
ncbi:MAG: imelysin family protein [Shimia sp.]|jgi:hypothetical protein|uniref:imelysin family protein n=1 Tax=Shimia sp. TaxID=1954381 RepID=UPI004059CE8F